MSYNDTASSGGLGDAFIVSLKLRKLQKEGHKINHLFIESNKKTVDFIKEFFSCFDYLKSMNISACHDENYYQNIVNKKYNEKMFLNTSVNGDYDFPCVDNIKLEKKDCFIDEQQNDVNKYDICVQCSAGANSNRKWKFDPRVLVKILRDKGYKVAIVGSDQKYYDKEDPDNFVYKSSLKESVSVIKNSNIYIGLSGFHTYWSLASKIRNIHFEESKEHNDHYICEEWNKYRYGIKFGTLQETIKGLSYFKIEV